jgi:uncharacterized protein
VPRTLNTVARVQEKKTWKPLAVAMLLALVFASAFLGLLAFKVFGDRVAQRWNLDRTYLMHIVAFVSLQGLALVWIQFFLDSHDVTWSEAFGFNRAPARSTGIGCATIAVALPVALIVIGNFISWLLKRAGIDIQPQTAVELVKSTRSPAQLAILGFAAVVLAPVAEEILFRGVLFQALRQRGYEVSAWLGTSFLFALIHGNLAALFPLMFLAVVFAWLYARTGNLLASITAHSVFNGLNFWLLVANPKWLEKFTN